MSRAFRSVPGWACFVCVALLFSGCSTLPNSGPSRSQVMNINSGNHDIPGVQLVDVTDDIARQLYRERDRNNFAQVFGSKPIFNQKLGIGDVVEISIWEAPPATLFGAGQNLSAAQGIAAPSGSHVTVLPDQAIDGSGNVNIPFVGDVHAADSTISELQRHIVARLKNMAHDPQVQVRLSRNETSYVTIIGNVEKSTRMQLTARGERILDALASAGGVRQAVGKETVQLTRNDKLVSMPLDTVIRDPKQNIPLEAGDVVTALYQPFSFSVIGAAGKSQEVDFETQGITLAQALARSGGLDDTRADAQGVFVFRLEDANALPWPQTPVRTLSDGRVPVVYRVNLRDPNSFFALQGFLMKDKDLLYVSNAPIAELQKVLNLIFSVAYPIVYGVQSFR
ncbi:MULTISPECIES: polysaccharide biosynthesis/export family protein [Burkholderia]|uniref:polysaccharide biosynthesis/export family protein n=1 Tax=Burkholderia TaxID=32008 RepID=UPI0013691217|nr:MULTISPECIES: polysaccharide biosynthesis/export family protein [Burkholderia]NBI47426.1 polysaccharide export protein [Burkholderia sp. ISTR5]